MDPRLGSSQVARRHAVFQYASKLERHSPAATLVASLRYARFVATFDETRRELARARNVFKQFRNTPELRALAETFLAFQPENEDDDEFSEILGWALTTLTRQGIFLAAYEAASAPEDYRARVLKIQQSLLRQVELDSDWSNQVEADSRERPELTPLQGGKDTIR